MSSRSISRTRSGCSSSVRNRSARESKPRRASRQRDEPVPRPPPNFDVWLTGSRGTWVDDEGPSAKHSRSGTNLGPTWDPHGMHEGKTSSTTWLPRRTPVRRQDLQKRLPTPPGGQGERAQAGPGRSSLVRTQSAEGRQATALSERRREPAAEVSGGVAALTCTSERPHNPSVAISEVVPKFVELRWRPDEVRLR